MTAQTGRARAVEVEAVRSPALLDRFLAAAPLLSIFFTLCFVYAFEAWSKGTPWLFSDEFEWTQLSRAIAQTGHAARRGEPSSFKSVYAYLIAPAWRISDTQSAYDTVKYIGVLLMTSVAFPAYGLARVVVSRNAALFVAAGSAVIPALIYSSFIITEPLAYPYAALCLFLIVKALATLRVRWLAAAAAASLFAPLVRGELAVLPAAYVLAALAVVWASEPVRRRWSRWSWWDWVGAAVLFVGAVLFVSAYLGHHSYTWLIATGYYKRRMLHFGLDSAGALMIGLGILPFVVGLAAIVPRFRAPSTPELRAFRSVLASAIVVFMLYTAVKAAYVSTVFEGRISERNLIYVVPLLLAGTALWFERRALNMVAAVGAAGLALALVLITPYKMNIQLYSDAPGLAILQQANRYVHWTPTDAKIALLVVFAATVALLTLSWRGDLWRAGLWRGTVVGAGVFVLAWSFTGELAAAQGSKAIADNALRTMGRPLDWLDRETHGQPAVYIGQHVSDAQGVQLLEFWNRSLTRVWSLDGTAPGPGPTLTPDLLDVAGDLEPDPHIPYVVADSGISVAGRLFSRHSRIAGGGRQYWRLYRVSPPFRLRANLDGRDADGWITASGPDQDAIASYNQYTTRGGRRGKAVVTVSRRESGFDVPSSVVIYVGTLIVGNDHQPHLGRVTAVRRWTVNEHLTKTFVIPAPSQRFRVEVHIKPTFQPCVLDPVTSVDCRWLGAVVRFGVLPRGQRLRDAEMM